MLGYRIMIRASSTLFLLSLLTGAVAQSGLDLSCVSGQQSPPFPLNLLGPCIVCVSFDLSALCSDEEADCTWGNNPTEPSCAPPPTVAPENKCHPDDVPPTIDPSIAILIGGQPCYACLSIFTYHRCTGIEGEICDWRDCDQEIVKATSPVPGATESSEAPDVSKAPYISCQPGDNTPTLPDGECVACLNNETLQSCRGAENEPCFWRDCDDQLVPMLLCQPGSEFAIPGLRAECNLQCLNVETWEPCRDGDLHCSFPGSIDYSCLNITVDPSATVDPCPVETKCDPGVELVAVPGFPPECNLKCRNIDTNELCSDGDSCCGYEQFNISCVTLPTITTTIPEPVCQPGDKPPFPPSIACYKCLSRTRGVCIAGQYCDWQQLDRSQCPEPTKSATEAPIPKPTKPASEAPELPSRCEPVTTPDVCPTCLCLNEDCDQCPSKRSEQCSWQDINECKGINNIEKPVVEMKRFSLTFKIADCRDILDNDGQRQEFLGSFIQQIMGLIGTEPTDINLSCGSLIADFTVYDDQLDLQAAEDKLNREIKNGNFKVDVEGTEYTATGFKDITQDSGKQKSAFSSFTSLSWFIIAAVAFVLLFAVFIIFASLCCDIAGLRGHQEKALLDSEQEGTYTQGTGQKLSSDDMYEHNINIGGNEYVGDTNM